MSLCICGKSPGGGCSCHWSGLGSSFPTFPQPLLYLQGHRRVGLDRAIPPWGGGWGWLSASRGGRQSNFPDCMFLSNMFT